MYKLLFAAKRRFCLVVLFTYAHHRHYSKNCNLIGIVVTLDCEIEKRCSLKPGILLANWSSRCGFSSKHMLSSWIPLFLWFPGELNRTTSTSCLPVESKGRSFMDAGLTFITFLPILSDFGMWIKIGFHKNSVKILNQGELNNRQLKQHQHTVITITS